jgi:F-type H+-transporting ATPase subunit alpha
MKQKQYAPMSVAEMALSIYAVNNGYMDKVDRRKVVDFEAALQAFAKAGYADLLNAINANPNLTPEFEAALKKLCEDFLATGTY